MKPSEKIALISIGIAVALTFLISLVFPMGWLAFSIVALLIGGLVYRELLKIESDASTIDRDDKR